MIDYKTDALDGRRPAELAARFSPQREVYALACRRRGWRPRDPRFLEAPDEPVIERLDREGLAEARSRLERLIAGMGSGEFEVGPSPTRSSCFGCPAADLPLPTPRLATTIVRRLAVFGYGSLVGRDSAADTLGRGLATPLPARTHRLRRALDPGRDNRHARSLRPPDGSLPRHCLGLNLGAR